MSLHYLVDGYNIVKQAPVFADQKLEDGRHGLLRWIDVHRPQGSPNNRVTVVFDGSPEHFGATAAGIAHVVFSRNESADDRLKTMVEQSPARSNLVIVSDDKGITLYVRSLGARIMSVQKFAPGLFAPSDRSPLKRSSTGEKSVKYISLAKAQRINKEMSKIWGID